MKLRWTARSRDDLVDIGRYIGRDKPGSARKWVDRLRRKAVQVIEMPRSGRRVPELERDDIREIVEQGYRIVYQVVDDEIYVLTVFEGHRRLRPTELETADG